VAAGATAVCVCCGGTVAVHTATRSTMSALRNILQCQQECYSTIKGAQQQGVARVLGFQNGKRDWN
jgi:hypothetical protein